MSATAAYSASFLLLTTNISPMFDTPTTSATQLKVEPQNGEHWRLRRIQIALPGELALATALTENAGEHCVRACSYQVEDVDWNNGNWFADGQAAKATTALL
ncbi:hypothetical protein B0H11DRAFT_1906517 [Mycena galericulata]|nr:hypothetical protein B0H11DRAFT_1906517 [Mycena galericulata]